MLRADRDVDHSFLPRHRLFIRCTTEDVADGRLIGSRVPYKNTSVNWSKYSKAWDVIFDYPGFGFAQFIVRRLPKQLPKELPDRNARTFTFFPGHVPLENNFSHSEIWTFRDGQRFPEAELSKTAKKEFRTILSDHSLLLWEPDI